MIREIRGSARVISYSGQGGKRKIRYRIEISALAQARTTITGYNETAAIRLHPILKCGHVCWIESYGVWNDEQFERAKKIARQLPFRHDAVLIMQFAQRSAPPPKRKHMVLPGKIGRIP